MVSGNLLQEGVPENFFIPPPMAFTFSGERYAGSTIHALGPMTPFQIKLPSKPVKVELDSPRWVLSEKTETK